MKTEAETLRRLHGLSPEAFDAMLLLLGGKACHPTNEVATELGRAGLAYRPDRRASSRRVVLTQEGQKYIISKP